LGEEEKKSVKKENFIVESKNKERNLEREKREEIQRIKEILKVIESKYFSCVENHIFLQIAEKIKNL